MKRTRRRVLPLLILCGAAINVGAAPPPPELALATRLFDEGRYELVLNALEPVVEMDLSGGDAARALYLRAESLYQLGRGGEARADFARLWENYPKTRWIEHSLARLASLSLDAEEDEKAASYVDELAGRFPHSLYLSRAMLALGLSELGSGDYAGAAGTLRDWLERFGDSPGTEAARLGLARAYVALGRYGDAAGKCRDVLASATSAQAGSEAASLLVESLYSDRRFEDLVHEGESLETRITEPGVALRARLLCSIALVRAGEAARGMERLQGLLGESDVSSMDAETLVDAYAALAGSVMAASPEPDRRRVYSAYDAALALLRDGSDEHALITVLNRKGLAAWSLSDATTAVSCFEASTEGMESTRLVSGAVNLGWVLRSQGYHDEALKTYTRVLGQDPRPPGWEWALIGKAECAYEQGAWERCRAALAEIPAPVSEFSSPPADLIHQLAAVEVVRRAIWLRGAAALEVGELEAAGVAFGDLLHISPDGSEDRALALLGLAEVARRRGNPDRAALLFEQVLVGEGLVLPPSPETDIARSRRKVVEPALFGLACARQDLKDGGAALGLFEATLALFPDGRYAEESLFRQAEILESAGDLDEAREGYVILAKRERVSEFALEAARRAAMIDAGLGRIEEAERRLHDLLEAVVGKAGVSLGSGTAAFEEAVRYDLGSLYLTGGRNKEAGGMFARNLERFPDGPGVDRNLHRLGQAQYNNGEFQKAAATYKRLVELGDPSPLVPDALLWLGWSYQNLGMTQQAQVIWNRLEREFPESDSAPLAAAAQAQQVESASPAAAAGVWSRLAETYRGKPLAPVALFRAGLLALEAMELAAAVGYFRRYREIFPDGERVAESYVWEGMAHEAKETPAEARQAFEAYLAGVEAGAGEEDPALCAAAVAGKARSLRALGDPHGAASFLQTELAKPGSDSEMFRDAWVLLGDVFFEVGRPQEALPAYRRVATLARGDRVEARVTLRIAECLEAMEKPREAAMQYVRVAYLYESLPDLATVGMIRAADLFEKLGNHREAIRSYRRALELSPTSEQKVLIEQRVAWLEEHLGLLELELPRAK